jgi:hypothetical protein
MNDNRPEDDGKGGTLKGPMSTSGASQGKVTTADKKSVPDPLGLTKALKDND